MRRVPLYDCRTEIPDGQRVRRGPELHFVQGLSQHLPWLQKRAVVCLSDWQFDVPSQRHFWTQTMEHLHDELGAEQVAQALFLVAGDMASCDNALRGVASDAAPDFSWLVESLTEENEVYVVYGNHDVMAAEHYDMRNSIGSRCILPQGAVSTAGVVCDRLPAKSVEKGEDPRETYELQDPVVKGDSSTDESLIDQRPAAAEAVAGEALSKEALEGLSKSERDAYYQRLRTHNPKMFTKKVPKLTKLQAQEKQWCDQNAEESNLVNRFLLTSAQESGGAPPTSGTARCELRIGCVHGIPASHSQGLKKIERGAYFGALKSICCGERGDEKERKMEILMSHSNPCLPGQEDVVCGDDAKEIFQLFMKSSARLHVHGHMHTPEVVSVIEEGKIVVNADCRVVVLLRDASVADAAIEAQVKEKINPVTVSRSPSVLIHSS